MCGDVSPGRRKTGSETHRQHSAQEHLETSFSSSTSLLCFLCFRFLFLYHFLSLFLFLRLLFHPLYYFVVGLDNDTLRNGRSGDRIPVGARFSAPIQTGPGTHSASCKMGTAAWVWRCPPTPSSAEVKERVELHLYCPSEPSWPFPW